MRKELDTIHALMVGHKEEEALALLQRLYTTYRPLEKIERGSEQEKKIAWEIVDLHSSLSFKKKYSADL